MSIFKSNPEQIFPRHPDLGDGLYLWVRGNDDRALVLAVTEALSSVGFKPRTGDEEWLRDEFAGARYSVHRQFVPHHSHVSVSFRDYDLNVVYRLGEAGGASRIKWVHADPRWGYSQPDPASVDTVLRLEYFAGVILGSSLVFAVSDHPEEHPPEDYGDPGGSWFYRDAENWLRAPKLAHEGTWKAAMDAYVMWAPTCSALSGKPEEGRFRLSSGRDCRLEREPLYLTPLSPSGLRAERPAEWQWEYILNSWRFGSLAGIEDLYGSPDLIIDSRDAPKLPLHRDYRVLRTFVYELGDRERAAVFHECVYGDEEDENARLGRVLFQAAVVVG